ncbi:MAG: Pathosis-related transcriptional factor and protein [Clostridiaceae bacterium]|jgi:hypothetical protein|nr:Pathosis-related transcriptional factor and protein [Clostridiaceae bacterium]MDF2950482.1 Pathosis-related transcriptional factor and protein [Anaerocolumna sp.]
MKKRDGRTFYTTIDTDDLQRLIDLKVTWHAILNPVNGLWYAQAGIYLGCENGKYKYSSMMMQWFIGNPDNIKGIQVDHIDHDGLNNRKSNLRISKYEENLRNRKSKNITNKSGYRNVSQNGKWWVVTMRVDGKHVELAKFKNVDDAGICAEILREKYYGDYAGES